jgi:hypothetical protein
MNDWRRMVIGVLAVGCLVTGGVAWWLQPNPMLAPVMAGSIRLGGMFAILWLALPELRNPKNLVLLLGIVGVGVGIILLPRLPWGKILIGLAAVLPVLWILRPRRRTTHGGTKTQRQ